MDTNTIMYQLAVGELSNSSYVETPDIGFTIKLGYQLPILTLIRQGLAELYKRFEIKTSYLDLQPDGRKRYELLIQNAVSSGNPNAIILDSAQSPFLQDIEQITNISNAKGERLALGTRPIAHPAMCQCAMCKKPVILQPFRTTLIIPEEITEVLTVEYRARHPFIPPMRYYTNIELELPDEYTQALLYFIAMKLIVPKPDTRSQVPQGQTFNALFEAECARLLLLGVETKQVDSRTFNNEHMFP